jgi:hypothetical protein
LVGSEGTVALGYPASTVHHTPLIRVAPIHE